MVTDNRYFDSAYGIPSASIASTGDTVVCTNQAFYHGVAAIPATTNYSITIYDNMATGSGNILDVVLVGSAGTGVRALNYIPVVAKNGITVTISGLGDKASIFYSPKG